MLNKDFFPIRQRSEKCLPPLNPKYSSLKFNLCFIISSHILVTFVP